jgi:hypothetical protein
MLREVAGWEVTSVKGPVVQLMYDGIAVTHDSKRMCTTVLSPREMDPLQQFTHSLLTPMKGALRNVPPLLSKLIQSLNTISQTLHSASHLRTELALIRSRHPTKLSFTPPVLTIAVTLLLVSARTKFHLTFTLSPEWFRGGGVQVQVTRVYGEVDLAEVRRMVESRVRTGETGCIKGVCDEVLEIWE